MKVIKKILAVVAAAVLSLAIAIPAMAASIQVQDVLDGETYTAYKILNYTDNGKTGTDRAVSYYLTSAEYASIGSALETAGFAFTASSDGTVYFVNNADSIDVAAAAASLASATLGDALGKYTAIGANGEANFENLVTGYYFVTTTAGSLCALHEDSDIATAVEKNTVPSVDKTQSASGEENTYSDDSLDENIGDLVYYKLEITDGTGTNADVTVTDTMTDGLTYQTGTIKINGAAVADDADTDNWKVTVSGQTITIVLKAAYVSSLDTGEIVTITFTAKINENAVVDDPDDNDNTVTITYSNQSSTDTVYVSTYDFIVYKVDDNEEFLDGAGFKLYDAATGGNQITLGKDNIGYYVDADSDEEILIESSDGVNVRGLEPGIYYLEETTVPDGYNKLADRAEVTITSGATTAVEIIVVNNPGTELPSTGGIGTTIFYVVGAILVVGAGVVLVTRRKMNAE